MFVTCIMSASQTNQQLLGAVGNSTRKVWTKWLKSKLTNI